MGKTDVTVYTKVLRKCFPKSKDQFSRKLARMGRNTTGGLHTDDIHWGYKLGPEHHGNRKAMGSLQRIRKMVECNVLSKDSLWLS